MSESNAPAPQQLSANLPIQGGAAIVAPVGAFPGGLPPNALVVLPLKKPTAELEEKLKQGAVAVTPEEMWRLLGFNGPAVQVQDGEGRPLTIGLDDLLNGLEKHWKEDESDLNRGRLCAQELMKYGRHAQAEKVLAKVVAMGGTGEDWLALGIAQSNCEQWDKAESTLKGAQNLLAQNPFPSLHLAKVYRQKQEHETERAMVDKAISIDPDCVDAWAYLFTMIKRAKDEAAAITAVEQLAEAEANARSSAPFVALQGFFAAKEETRDRAFEFARKALERNPDDSLALVALSALHGQKGDLKAVIALLQPHENKMMRDVRLANNYFEALFQARELDKVTRLLNALGGSSMREVKQFAVERSRMVAQFLQQQQAQLKGAARPVSNA